MLTILRQKKESFVIKFIMFTIILSFAAFFGISSLAPGNLRTQIPAVVNGEDINGKKFDFYYNVEIDQKGAAIVQFIKRNYNLLVGERTAELIKINIGNAFPNGDTTSMQVSGRDLIGGIPRHLEINSDEMREAMAEPVHTIIEAIKATLEKTPPELAGDIVEKGIMLAGGGALINGIDKLIHEETGLPVMIADDPLSSVAHGAGKALDELSVLREVSM